MNAVTKEIKSESTMRNQQQYQSGMHINDSLPSREGVSHYNININSPSFIGSFLSSTTHTPFSPGDGEVYACPESYFLHKRYSFAGIDISNENVKNLSGGEILHAKKRITTQHSFSQENSLMRTSQGDSVKEVLREVLCAKFLSFIIATIELGIYRCRYTQRYYLCYLSCYQGSDTYTNTRVYRQLGWMPQTINNLNNALRKINATTEDGIQQLKKHCEERLATIEEDITFYFDNNKSLKDHIKELITDSKAEQDNLL